jgi:BirA family biotin operon repressor/biotin-[acetyl-CoA-carboxylase] ligase
MPSDKYRLEWQGMAQHGLPDIKTRKRATWKEWFAEAGTEYNFKHCCRTCFIAIENQFVLSAIVALACSDFFNKYAGETKIKWPNDLYWKDRKAGGILIENFIKGKVWNFAIIGIGININQTLFPAQVANAVSLKQITGKTYNVVDLAKELCSFIEIRWQQLKVKSRYGWMNTHRGFIGLAKRYL